MRFLLATRNPGKLAELESLLADLPVELVSLEAFPEVPEAVEDGDTFRENARKKALHYSRATGLPAIADDSGLTIEALGGWPGVRSSRVAQSDPERIAKVLQALREFPTPERRRAAFECAVACRLPSGEWIEGEGRVEGLISLQPAGSGGFGYDPIFFYPPAGKTFAEMGPAEKNAVSHRGRALADFKRRLEAFFAALPRQ
ncbi:MAG: XTP/dITP diphosphatase [Acidobacteriota bacterium]